ncbi:hypothetical protein ABIE18_002097 [Arthrobacter sp. 2762]
MVKGISFLGGYRRGDYAEVVGAARAIAFAANSWGFMPNRLGDEPAFSVGGSLAE